MKRRQAKKIVKRALETLTAQLKDKKEPVTQYSNSQMLKACRTLKKRIDFFDASGALHLRTLLDSIKFVKKPPREFTHLKELI